jgi:hypothetical protein
VLFLPDILAAEKAEIKSIATKYARSLWTIPFDKGIVAYTRTSNELFVHPARWRYCFKCGMILKANLVKDPELEDETTNHSCILEFEDIPLLIKTSWFKLREFFLINKNHSKIINEIGLPKLPKPITVTKPAEKLEKAEIDSSEAVKEEFL